MLKRVENEKSLIKLHPGVLVHFVPLVIVTLFAFSFYKHLEYK